MKKSLILIAISALFIGCIVGEVEHTLYLEPDGGLVWTVLEHGVHSDASDLEQRDSEERSFLASRRPSASTLEAAFELLGAQSAETTVLRGTRPMVVWTEARFASPVEPLERFMGELGVAGSVQLSIADGVHHLKVCIEPELSDDQEIADEAPVLELIDDLSAYQIVLSEGRFVAAEGFEISSDNRVATPLAINVDEESDTLPGPIVYSLSWNLTDE